MRFAKYIFLAFMFFWIHQLQAQTNVIIFTVAGYNSFEMWDLKNNQVELVDFLIYRNIPVNIFDSYPAYYGYKVGFQIPFTRVDAYSVWFGGILEYTSTGGRAHYKDYSGEILADQIASVYSYGGLLDYQIQMNSWFLLSFHTSPRYCISTIVYNLYSRLGSESNTQNLTFKSSSFGIEYGFTPTFHYKGIRIGISLSCYYYVPSELENDQNSGIYLQGRDGHKILIDWSGFRIGGLFGIEL